MTCLCTFLYSVHYGGNIMSHNSRKQKVPLKDICAVLCNYARPKNARACVKRLLSLGITEVFVWNNGAKPIPEATYNIINSKNIGPYGKYLGAINTTKPYVLVIDDDYLLTKAGLDALRKWVLYYPAVAQQGSRFKPPFTKYGKRDLYLSQNLKVPKKVDMVMPNKGMMIKTTIYQLIPKHWAWEALKVLSKNIFTTDLSASCAIWDLTKKNLAVVPVSKGYEIIRDEAPKKALKRQKNIYHEKSKILCWLVAHGWKLFNSRKLKSKK